MATSSIFLSFICFITIIFLSSQVESKRYDNKRSVRIKISNEFQLEAIQNMTLDVWRGLTIGYNDVMMSDDDIVKCWDYNVPTEILILNIKNCMEREAEEAKLDFGSANTGDEWFSSYHTYEEMLGLMDMIAADHPHLVKYTASIGTTYEGRDIPVVTITPPTNTKKINITVIGGMEARAWNAPTTVLFIFKKLVDLYYTDKNVTDLLEKLSISFIPITNPDGYEYSRTADRLWKKNRRPFSNGQYGVDLNRNFDDHWGLSCGNSTAASGEYCGPSPNSENETIAIRDYILSHGPFSGGVYYSSYGQSILRPYGWTNAVPTRDPLLKSIANQWSAKIKEVNGNEYTSKIAYEEFSISGTVYDWMFSHANVSFPYSVQLGDDGRYGYLIPSSQILRIALENLKGFEYFCQSVSAWEK